MVRYAAVFVRRAAAFAVLWWILAEGEVRSPLIAALLVLATAAVSFAVLRPSASRVRLRHLPGFVFYFVKQSLFGGLDVARRAVLPSMPLNPGLVEVALNDRSPAELALAVNVTSLLPGTLAAQLDGGRLLVHALDTRQPIAERLGELRTRVGDLLR